MRKTLSISLSLIFVLIALAPVELHGAKPDIPIILVEKMKPVEISEEITYPARVSSLVNATVLSETAGVVKQVNTRLGSFVKRGQALALVEHTDPVFKYAPVTVRAHISGVVSSIDITRGTNVAPGTPIATLTDPRKLQVTIEVPAVDLTKIHRGLGGTFKGVGELYAMSVAINGVSPYVDPTTGTATAQLKFLDPFEKIRSLRPGLVGTVSFRTARHKGFQITEDAIVYRGKLTYVRVVEDTKAQLTPVKLGRSQRGIVEILEGVSKGTTVVVRSSQFIADGDEVAIEAAQEATKKTPKTQNN